MFAGENGLTAQQAESSAGDCNIRATSMGLNVRYKVVPFVKASK